MEQKYKMLPFQVIEMEDRIVLKRGLSSMAISDKNALIIIKVIQKALLQGPKTITELTQLFTGAVQNLIRDFVEHLITKKYLIPESDGQEHLHNEESPQDIFYWHFNLHQADIAKVLNEQVWAFIGINELNKRLIQSLFAEGKESFIVVDDPSLRNVKYYDDQHEIIDAFWKDDRIEKVSEEEFIREPNDIGFMVAASEFGSFYLLESWNAYAVKNAIPFYPLLLQNMVGYAGPLVIRDEGACLECVKLRQNSASHNFAEKRLTEKFASQGQHVVAYHQSMVNILAEVGAFDLVRFKSNIQWDLSTMCEVDLLSSTMTKRKLMKAPRCPVCSALDSQPLVNIHKQLTSEESWQEIEQTVGYDE
ncbi:hypothetical protein [Fulvivirga ligni]|uniref:hypothetical protein n=1 Tax=Fulvivirga ligni TaxID=2904246 RepID=UPI001F322D26|nr:hypothetical protein [Fulvivirga ligni]UII21553.1 hypothetical protein LVD16_27375 [Fulvivirga ligni]